MANACAFRQVTDVITRSAKTQLAAALLFALLAPLGVWAQSDSDKIAQAAALIQNNRLDEAERELNLLLKAKPNQAAALNLLGTIRAQQGNLNEAETLFTRAVRIDNRLVAAHLNLARLYLLRGAPEKTVAELKEVLRFDPGNAEAGYRLAWVLFSLARFDECVSFVETHRQRLQPSASLLALLGDAYMKKNDPDKAETNYLAALAADGANADALMGRAMVARARKDDKAAIFHLNEVRHSVTDSPDLLYKFARIALDLKLAAGALQALNRAIELRPGEPSYHFLSGVAWLEKPDLDEAESSFRKSLRLRPDYAASQVYLGYVLLKKKELGEAREWLERSIQKTTGQKNGQKETGEAETYYYLGLIAQEQNEHEKAESLFASAIRLAPTFAHAHIALGSMYLKLKNYPRAQQSLELGVKLDPGDEKAHYNLALLYSRLNEPERAREEMLIVERLKNNSGQKSGGDAVTPPAIRPN